MSQTRTIRRRARRGGMRGAGTLSIVVWGLGAAVLTTLAGVAIFALLMQWIRPSDQVVRIVNQGLKVASICVGVASASHKGAMGPLRGALLGLLYMALGVALYALLSGQSAPITAYLADLGMGVACGGLVGLIRK